jgi:hypothetical protein
MLMLKKAHNRLLLLLLFGVACMRLVARVLPVNWSTHIGEGAVRAKGIRRGLLARAVRSTGQSYALETTGAFPYVRIVPVATRAVPVPVEIASLSLAAGSSIPSTQATQHNLMLKTNWTLLQGAELVADLPSGDCCAVHSAQDCDGRDCCDCTDDCDDCDSCDAESV